MVSARSHVEELQRVAQGDDSRRDRAVLRSWLRCLHDYRLDPARAQAAYIVPAIKLKEHREQTEELIRIGRSALEGLFRHVVDQNYVLLLSDAQGVTVDFMGDPTFDNQLRRAGLYLGAEWSESRAGTCAVGACIVSGEPVIIHQDDHFDTSHIGLTCTAAPIFDTLGDLTAVLDISQLRSPTAKTSQQLALHLVSTTARRVELAHLLARRRGDWILRLSRSPDFLDVDPEAAVSIDAGGRISGLTHGGFQALAGRLDLGQRPTRSLIGTPISDLLDLEPDQLPQLMHGRPAGERVVRSRSSAALFASALAPAVPLRRSRERPAAPPPARLPPPLQALSFGDPVMASLQQRAAKLAAHDIAILIQGETGSGKEYFARALHNSRPQPGPFVAVNCAAIPDSLIEAELFGYRPGAFTGAAPKGQRGLIEAADGGTLFLDEIGDMPLNLQARLLRVLSEGEVTPIGAGPPKAVRFRLISASLHRLEQLVASGRFREDLLYRLNAATVQLPPLRERHDLPGLIDHLLGQIAEDQGRALTLTPAARAQLLAARWPGNLRQLANSLRVAAALCDGGVIDLGDLPDHHPAASPAATNSDPDDLAAQLAACNGNVSELARRLGLDRSTIHRRLRRLRHS